MPPVSKTAALPATVAGVIRGRRWLSRVAPVLLAAMVTACAPRVIRVSAPQGALDLDQFLAAHRLPDEGGIRADQIGRTEGASYHVVQVLGSERPHRHETHDLDGVRPARQGRADASGGQDAARARATPPSCTAGSRTGSRARERSRPSRWWCSRRRSTRRTPCRSRSVDSRRRARLRMEGARGRAPTSGRSDVDALDRDGAGGSAAGCSSWVGRTRPRPRRRSRR